MQYRDKKDGCAKANRVEQAKAKHFNSLLLLSNSRTRIFKCFKFILTDCMQHF